MARLQEQVAAATEQLESAKEVAKQRKEAEREVEERLEDAKAQLQVGGAAGRPVLHISNLSHATCAQLQLTRCTRGLSCSTRQG